MTGTLWYMQGSSDGYAAGYTNGRREMLWLMGVGAACAEAIYRGLDQGDINGCHDWYDRELAARRTAEIAAVLLAYPVAS